MKTYLYNTMTARKYLMLDGKPLVYEKNGTFSYAREIPANLPGTRFAVQRAYDHLMPVSVKEYWQYPCGFQCPIGWSDDEIDNLLITMDIIDTDAIEEEESKRFAVDGWITRLQYDYFVTQWTPGGRLLDSIGNCRITTQLPDSHPARKQMLNLENHLIQLMYKPSEVHYVA